MLQFFEEIVNQCLELVAVFQTLIINDDAVLL